MSRITWTWTAGFSFAVYPGGASPFTGMLCEEKTSRREREARGGVLLGKAEHSCGHVEFGGRRDRVHPFTATVFPHAGLLQQDNGPRDTGFGNGLRNVEVLPWRPNSEFESCGTSWNNASDPRRLHFGTYRTYKDLLLTSWCQIPQGCVVNGLHLYSAFIQSTVQFLPLMEQRESTGRERETEQRDRERRSRERAQGESERRSRERAQGERAERESPNVRSSLMKFHGTEADTNPARSTPAAGEQIKLNK